MGMTHSSSGKHGYRLHHRPTTYSFTREDLIKVLRLEDNIRASEEVQQAYSKDLAGNAYLEHIRDVTLTAQRRALRESRVLEKEEDLEQVLIALHNHRWTFKDDKEVMGLSVYGRYDVCWNGSLALWQEACDAPLHDLEGNAKTLKSLWKGKDIPTLVIASSLS